MKAGIEKRLARLELGFRVRVVEHPPMIVTARDSPPSVSALTHSGEHLQWSARETGEVEMPAPLLDLLDRWAPDLAARYRRYRAARREWERKSVTPDSAPCRAASAQSEEHESAKLD